MEELKRFTSFYDDCEDIFYEHLDGIKMYLRKTNEKYIDIENKIRKILDKDDILQCVFEGQTPSTTLSNEQSKLLCIIINLLSEKRDIEEKEIYFKGGMDAYYYFKKIGILK